MSISETLQHVMIGPVVRTKIELREIETPAVATRRHGPVRSVRATCRRSPATTAGGGPPSGCYDRRRRRGPHAPAAQFAGTCESAEPASPDASVRRPSERWQPFGVPCAHLPPREGRRPGSPNLLHYLRGQDTRATPRRCRREAPPAAPAPRRECPRVGSGASRSGRSGSRKGRS